MRTTDTRWFDYDFNVTYQKLEPHHICTRLYDEAKRMWSDHLRYMTSGAILGSDPRTFHVMNPRIPLLPFNPWNLLYFFSYLLLHFKSPKYPYPGTLYNTQNTYIYHVSICSPRCEQVIRKPSILQPQASEWAAVSCAAPLFWLIQLTLFDLAYFL